MPNKHSWVEDSSTPAAATAVPLPMTGERTAPATDQENYWFRRHEVLYLYMQQFCAGKELLEAGSGEGYGVDLLAEDAASIVALDYDHLACRHAATGYGQSHTHFAQADLTHLPLAANSFDTIINSQVIEHLPDQPAFMDECYRVLRPGGEFFVATPNRITFTPEGQPINPFHLRELNARELAELFVEAGFTLTACMGVYHGENLRALDGKWDGFINAQLQPFLEDRPWSEELRADVDSVQASDFDVREVDPSTITDTLSPTASTELDDSLDLFFVGLKER